ncbi:glycosyltransferase [Paenibacillus assamensis]|uniref:glycosyltransferase n=1 Tax=Paenibacillus assamensis TaxID=311244 RepID=UPI0003F68C58|nr:glycosyltransferase [Paenibacillus assamensis]
MKINIIIPVLNEELRIRKGIETAIDFLEMNLSGKYKLTIVDNGSTDKTEQIANELIQKHGAIDYIKLSQRGVGLALREAAKVNEHEIIGYMDVDLSTDLRHILEVYDLFEKEKNTNIVNGSRLLSSSEVEGRKVLRGITSRGLNVILKVVLGVKFTDAMCGFKFFKKDTLNKLIEKSSDNNGWFYCTELLVRAEWERIQIKELPVKWEDDPNSKVKVIKLSINYLKEIIKLRKDKKRSTS